MSEIEWLNDFDISADGKIQAKMHVAKHDGGMFTASCLYLEDGRLLSAKKEDGALPFKLKKICGDSADEVVQEITEWAKGKFGENIEFYEKSIS